VACCSPTPAPSNLPVCATPYRARTTVLILTPAPRGIYLRAFATIPFAFTCHYTPWRRLPRHRALCAHLPAGRWDIPRRRGYGKRQRRTPRWRTKRTRDCRGHAFHLAGRLAFPGMPAVLSELLHTCHICGSRAVHAPRISGGASSSMRSCWTAHYARTRAVPFHAHCTQPER